MSFYTTAQRKAFVRAALEWLDRNERETVNRHKAPHATVLMYRERILFFTPKGRDPLDWSTEP